MSGIRFDRGLEYEIVKREYVRTRWTKEAARDFVNRYKLDKAAMAGFRDLIAKRSAKPGGKQATDQEVLDEVARLMVSGELVVIEPRRKRIKMLDHKEAEVQQAPPPRQQTVQEETADPDTFTGGDLNYQAMVLVIAAQKGAPFCEECEKLNGPAAAVVVREPVIVQPAPEQDIQDLKSAPTFTDIDGAKQAQTLIAAAEAGVAFCEECAKRAAAAAPPPESKTDSAETRFQDTASPATLPPNTDAEQQAATLKAAAEDGTPFCQECAKAAEAKAAAGPQTGEPDTTESKETIR